MPGQNWWDAEYIRNNFPDRVFTDDRPGAPKTHVWWVGNQAEVGIFLHGYKSAWLPASLLTKERRERLADALLASSRHSGGWPCISTRDLPGPLPMP